MNELFIHIHEINAIISVKTTFSYPYKLFIKYKKYIFFYRFNPNYSSKIPLRHRSLLISILSCVREHFHAADATIWLSFFLFSLATVSIETILLVSFSAAVAK